jgi:hypothetical protein
MAIEDQQLEIVSDPNVVTRSGLTKFQMRELAREGGFTGEFGAGEHKAFLDATAENRALFESNIAREVARQTRVFGSTQGFIEAKGAISTLQAAKASLSFVKFAGSGAFEGVSAAIDNAASRALPSLFGAPGVRGAPVGNLPFLPEGTTAFQGSTTGATFTGVLAGAGTGFTIGSLVGTFTDLKTKGSQIGGTVGGIAGSVVPVIGTVAGSIVGSVIGGFFGPDAPVQASEFFATFGEKGKLQDITLGEKTIGTQRGRTVGLGFGEFVETINKEIGADLSNTFAFGGFNDKQHGGFFVQAQGSEGIIGEKQTFEAGEEADVESAFFNVVDTLIRQNEETNAQIIARVDSLKAEGLSSQEAISQIYKDKIDQAAIDSTELIDTVGKTPEQRVETRVINSANQIDSYLEKVKKRTAGRAATIKTGPRGLLEETPVFKKQLGGVAI